VLGRLGVLEAARAVAAAPERGSLRGADGRVLAEVPAGDALLVSRSELVRLLQRALPAEVRTVEGRIEDVRPLRARTDLLIGADGVHSLVRRSGWPGRPAARSHGVTVLRGTTDAPPPEISETWGGGWLFGITPLAGIGTNWFACVPEHRSPSVSASLEHLRSVVGGHRRPIDVVLSAASPERTLVHGILTVPAVLPVRDGTVLLGDAAHAMAPNLGHGANTALADAGTLATVLTGVRAPAMLPAALREYSLRRTVPGQAWRLGSAVMLRLAMLDSGAALRDRALARIGALGAPAAPGTGSEPDEPESLSAPSGRAS
jgi:2-polyprenyl-6-methoxyphenol hydroxylase-like FAD-dependent oxidoreductase